MKTSHSAGVGVRLREDAIDFVVIISAAFALIISHRLQHERRARSSVASSTPKAFLIFCLARENIVSMATTVRR